MVLRFDEDVKAEHGLEQRRVREGDAVEVGGGESETDGQLILY